MTTPTPTDIRAACETYLEEWDRHDWMSDHGSWASEEWDDARHAYDDAAVALADAVADAPAADDAVDIQLDDVRDALDALVAAATALRGQVLPDDDDYISDDVIDPDGVATRAQALHVGASAPGWDCVEGWDAWRVDDALYVRWWRSQCAGARRPRDLWVCVDDEFFASE